MIKTVTGKNSYDQKENFPASDSAKKNRKTENSSQMRAQSPKESETLVAHGIWNKVESNRLQWYGISLLLPSFTPK